MRRRWVLGGRRVHPEVRPELEAALGDAPRRPQLRVRRRQQCVPWSDARRRGGGHRVDSRIWPNNEKDRL